MENNMEIIMKKTGELIPYENNPRRNDQAVRCVANSIKEFGFKVPIVVDSAGVIIAGHTRLKAAESLGIEEVPVVVADDLTEEQVRAFRLADNKTGEMSGWDFDLLDSELSELDFDMRDFGFNITTIADSFFDNLEDSDEEETAGGYVEKNFFLCSFEFPVEFEENLKAYIKENGKKAVVEIIINAVTAGGAE
jgi:site-specific DNA-methyltransferase (adenine-specific)